MRDRLMIGPILVLGVVALLWLEESFGGTRFHVGSAIGVVMVGVVWLGAGELAAIARALGVSIPDWHARACALVGLAIMFVDPSAMAPRRAAALVWGGAVVVLALSMALYARGRQTKGVTGFSGVSLISFVLLGLMFGTAFAIRREHSAWVLLWVVLTAKACDTGAYFTGRAIGRHKLIPWLSPGKTWEGLFGGAALSAMVGATGIWLLDRFTGSAPTPLALGALWGVIAAVLGQAGDLMASFLKRDAGLKDSGKTIPGMGGVLDVIDSPSLVLPAAYWWLAWLGAK